MIRTYEGLIIAKSPIHSGSDDRLGNESILRRMTFLVNGKPMEIPMISGNSIRGILRRKIMQDMLTAVQYVPESQTKYTKLHHMLFSGGVLETVNESEQGYIDLVMKHNIRNTLPPISVFGTAIRNQMIESKLAVSFAIPICRELRDYLPEHILSMPETNLSINSMLTEDFITRRDDLRNNRDKDDQAIQMIVHYEVFVPGTIFYHKFVLRDANDIETAVLGRAIELWKSEPFLGARSAQGYGNVVLKYPVIESDAWIKFMQSNKSQINDALRSIEQ